jgi:hypothetical protein
MEGRGERELTYPWNALLLLTEKKRITFLHFEKAWLRVSPFWTWVIQMLCEPLSFLLKALEIQVRRERSAGDGALGCTYIFHTLPDIVFIKGLHDEKTSVCRR